MLLLEDQEMPDPFPMYSVMQKHGYSANMNQFLAYVFYQKLQLINSTTPQIQMSSAIAKTAVSLPFKTKDGYYRANYITLPFKTQKN